MYRRSEHPDLDIRFGFGYDQTSDDYKVVRVVYDRSSDSVTKPYVQIYTVKTAIWREVVFPNDLPSSIFHACSKFVNGSIHWIACDWSVLRMTILTFDISTELFGEICFPESFVHLNAMKLRLAVVGDSLAMIHSKRKSLSWWSFSTYKIWAMKEYKNPLSWTMIYNVDYPEIDAGRALGLTKNGDLIAAESKDGDVMICKQERCYSVYGSCTESIDLEEEDTFVETYQESLALLAVGKLDDEV